MQFFFTSLLILTFAIPSACQADGEALTPEQIDEMLSKLTMQDMLKDNQCPNAHCTPSNLILVPHFNKLEFESSGCMGINTGNLKVLTSDIKEERFESCCDLWHACYQVCGVSKSVCDQELEQCTQKSCDLSEDGCFKQASMMTTMAKMQKCEFFEEAQMHSCMCVEPEKATKWREEAIWYFYQKYAPGNRDKAPELAEKAFTQSKTAALWRKLIAKYPESIKHVDNVELEDIRAVLNEEGWEHDPSRPGWESKEGKLKTTISLDDYWSDEEQEAFRQEQNEKLRERKRDRFGQDDSEKKEKKERFKTTTDKNEEKTDVKTE
jgi:hypothetical protein